MAKESLKSATDGHIVTVKPADAGSVSGKPTSDKFTFTSQKYRHSFQVVQDMKPYCSAQSMR